MTIIYNGFTPDDIQIDFTFNVASEKSGTAAS